MSIKKSLFVGCSFTADSGFTEPNRSKYHWPQLICQETGHVMINHALTGMSNHEIFLRTIESAIADNYDLVVVMWSEIGRSWAYTSDNNVDDYTILNRGVPVGFNCNTGFAKLYAKLYYTYFNNQYVNLKNWLLYCLSLEKFLKQQNVPYVFIKGFNNYVDDFAKITYNDGFVNVDNLKLLLDFDQRPDDYILKKVQVIQSLIQAQDQSRWLNLHGDSFNDMATNLADQDLSDDQQHPGAQTNQQLANHFVKFYKSLNEHSI